jgi:hypothetical protein
MSRFIVEGSHLDSDIWLAHSTFGDLTLEMAQRTIENVKSGRDNFRAHIKEKYNENHPLLKYRIVRK